MKKILVLVGMVPAISFAQWSTSGNSLASIGKLGSTNSQSVSFMTNNVERWNMSSSGTWKIGALSGSGTALFQLASDGTASRLNFSGNSSDVLTGSGNFSSLSSATGFSFDGSTKITTNYKLGLGVSNPVNKLEVDGSIGVTGSVYATHFVASDASMVQGQLSFTGNMFVNGYDAIAGTRNEVYTSTQPYYIQSAALYNNNTIINHNNTGKVGIGTNSPSAKFHVSGDSRFDGPVRMDSIQFGDSLMLKGGVGGAFGVGPTGGTLGWFPPACIIKGTAKAYQYVQGFFSTYSTPGSVTMGHNGTYGFIQSYGDGEAGTLRINTFCGKDVVMCAGPSAGNVGIGTSCIPTGYKLAVYGKIICEEVKVKLSDSGCWPDYVFGKDYELMPLSEVKAYISSNHHLPGMPAADEVESEGINTAEMLKIQTQKIEELTLYIMQLEERLKQLEKK